MSVVTAKRESYIIKALNKKILELGVTKLELDGIIKTAEEQYALLEKNARTNVEMLNKKYNITNHNDWHTETGQYDPTAKKALNKLG